jgi:REP-associated tyrosine transposase
VLAAALERYPVELLAFCVLNTHWHLVLRTDRTPDLSRFMHWLSTNHARTWRRRCGTLGLGAVYKGRFLSVPIQTLGDLVRVCRYVERNPLRAGLVAHAEDWPWSSLSERRRADRRVPLLAAPFLESSAWVRHVNQALTNAELASIAKHRSLRATSRRILSPRPGRSPAVLGSAAAAEP